MTTKLDIYNGALRLCKSRNLITESDNTESRRLLDAAWGDGLTRGAVRYCLEAGQWTFATRTLQIEYDPNVSPLFGYRYAFQQPNDMVRPAGVFQDEMCKIPLLDYSDERRYWFAHYETIWVKVISNLPEYGGDTSLWPEMFGKMIEAYLANEIIANLTHGNAQEIDRVARVWKDAKLEARSMDGMNKPTQFLPTGKWNLARSNGYRNRDREYRN